MPRLTERQDNANTLLNAFIVHLLAQMEAKAFHAGANSDSESDSECYVPVSRDLGKCNRER
jgi:hypothetical protein